MGEIDLRSGIALLCSLTVPGGGQGIIRLASYPSLVDFTDICLRDLVALLRRAIQTFKAVA